MDIKEFYMYAVTQPSCYYRIADKTLFPPFH